MCLLDLRIRFIFSRIKASRIQVVMQQDRQLPEVDEMLMSKLDGVGQRFRQQMSLIKMPRDSDRKGTILLIGRVCSPLSA
jgi:hypothetical protein